MLGAFGFLQCAGGDLAPSARAGPNCRTKLRPGDREVTCVDEAALVGRAGSKRRGWRRGEKILVGRRWIGCEDTRRDCGQGRNHIDGGGDENASSRAGWGDPLVPMLSHGADPCFSLAGTCLTPSAGGGLRVEHKWWSMPEVRARARAQH